jgi:hypothetical protein
MRKYGPEYNKHDTIEQKISHTPHAVESYGLVASTPKKLFRPHNYISAALTINTQHECIKLVSRNIQFHYHN